MSDSELANRSVAAVSTGRAVNEDSWMSTWCSTNWGDLLQPAPLSISLLGSILIIASSTDDFSLVTEAPPGCPPFKWEFAKHPDSFKTCLQQMVGDGYTAFETAHGNMETITNTAGQIPEVIRTLVNLILKGTARDIANHSQNSIDDLIQLSNRCKDAATETETAFKNLCGLAQEMVLACTYKSGTAEQALNQSEIHLAVLAEQKKHQESMVNDTRDTTDMMKKSYLEAEKGFHEALKSAPKGWEMAAMSAVESLTSLAVSAGNAAISIATLPTQVASGTISAFSKLSGKLSKKQEDSPAASTSSPAGVSTQPNQDVLYDPGTLAAERVLAQVYLIRGLLIGSAGKPDWEKIRKSARSKSGASYVLKTLRALQDQIKSDKPGPISLKLGPMIQQAIGVVDQTIKTGEDISRNGEDDALLDQLAIIEHLITHLEALVASVNLVLQQPGSVATGPATPQPPTGARIGTACIENARFKVNQARSQLETTRDSYEKASFRLCAQQQAITRTITEITQLSLTNANLQQLLPILKKAVGSFTILRAHLSQLVQFFHSVTSLLEDIMAPSVGRLVKTLQVAEQEIAEGKEPEAIGGVTMSAFTRDLMYRQMMMPLKVSTLASQISTVYVEVSNLYIMPAQRSVGQMLQFNTEGPDGEKEFRDDLVIAQNRLAKQTAEASEWISRKVAADQKQFIAKINARLDTIVTTTRAALPDVEKPVPPALKDVSESHEANLEQTMAQQAANNPIFDPNDAM